MTEAGQWPITEDGARVLATHHDGRGRLSLTLSVEPDCPWLDGHFPDRPVLPGVVQLRWAIGAACRAWPELTTVNGVANLKFSRPVLPPAELSLHLERNEDRRRVAFRYAAGQRTCSSGLVSFL